MHLVPSSSPPPPKKQVRTKISSIYWCYHLSSEKAACCNSPQACVRHLYVRGPVQLATRVSCSQKLLQWEYSGQSMSVGGGGGGVDRIFVVWRSFITFQTLAHVQLLTFLRKWRENTRTHKRDRPLACAWGQKWRENGERKFKMKLQNEWMKYNKTN